MHLVPPAWMDPERVERTRFLIKVGVQLTLIAASGSSSKQGTLAAMQKARATKANVGY